ncbi:hypothetical protein K1719_031476 [Acacia pycnantha]|nr:hypothetical protein K1719_031476 [Acacia pycnantha]
MFPSIRRINASGPLEDGKRRLIPMLNSSNPFKIWVFSRRILDLCVSTGARHKVMALTNMGLLDVTVVELIESPPLVSQADSHNLPSLTIRLISLSTPISLRHCFLHDLRRRWKGWLMKLLQMQYANWVIDSQVWLMI